MDALVRSGEIKRSGAKRGQGCVIVLYFALSSGFQRRARFLDFIISYSDYEHGQKHHATVSHSNRKLAKHGEHGFVGGRAQKAAFLALQAGRRESSLESAARECGCSNRLLRCAEFKLKRPAGCYGSSPACFSLEANRAGRQAGWQVGLCNSPVTWPEPRAETVPVGGKA